MVLTMKRGDARVIEVTLTLEGAPWTPPGDAVLRATGKYSFEDTDAEAVWAKDNTGAAITNAANVVSIVLDPEDTDAVAARGSNQTLRCDLQATSPTDGPWTVAYWDLIVQPDVTRTQP